MKKLLVILLSLVCMSAYSQSFYSVQPEGAGTITDSLVEYIFTDTLYDTNYVYTYDEDSTIIDSTLDITEYTIDDTVELVRLTAIANEGYEAVEDPIHTQIDTLSIYLSMNRIKDINQITYRVFPNPTTNMINVQGEFDNIVIYNQAGQQVISTNKSRIDVSKLSSGMYYIQIQNGDKMKIMPIVKTNKGRI